MKTKSWLLTIGVAAATTMTINVVADNGLLSPRAAGNQIIHTAGTNSDPNYVVLRQYADFVPPRVAGNQSVAAAGTNSDVNPATVCTRTMTASPKAIQRCIESGTMTGCGSNIKVAPLK